MPELMIDIIASLDGYASADGWPGLWGLGGPDYFAFLEQDALEDHTVLMGAATYRLFSGFVASGEEDLDALTAMDKVVFSSTLDEPLALGEHPVGARQRGGRGGSAEAGRGPLVAHDRQPEPVPIAAACRPGGPTAGGGVPGGDRGVRP